MGARRWRRGIRHWCEGRRRHSPAPRSWSRRGCRAFRSQGRGEWTPAFWKAASAYHIHYVARLHQLVGGPLNRVSVHVGEGHRCARLREGFCRRETHSNRGACHRPTRPFKLAAVIATHIERVVDRHGPFHVGVPKVAPSSGMGRYAGPRSCAKFVFGPRSHGCSRAIAPCIVSAFCFKIPNPEPSRESRVRFVKFGQVQTLRQKGTIFVFPILVVRDTCYVEGLR
jgi:hypothetical protein